MSVTLDTFQEARGWLKEEAWKNMWDRSVTLDTFQEEMSPLKEEAPLNMPDRSVARERSGASVAR